MTIEPTPAFDARPTLAAVARVVGRYALYTIFMAVMSVWLLELISLHAADETALEPARRLWWLQCVLAGAATATLLIGAWQSARGRPWLLLGGLLAGIVVTLELEVRWADQWLPPAGWTAVVVLLGAGAALCLWWGLRRRDGRGIELLSSPAPGILWAGLLLVAVFGPIAGQTEAWTRIMGERDSADLEWAIETMVQMLGYMLICLGSIELVLESTRIDRSSDKASEARRVAD